ncbi:hypothetical protein OG689_43615 [Kitasatospora sp. NBC_00240]|uniref:hypothetical protein n=1 Tax=Kitasatospora sp. NBC_00240 TaxID=2903567 RepID=UPI00225BEC5F|nr:hypothetical protein [Kitasatospora sp. NBC_00240]MCX5216025.1 hypothetical protein [Kitasatospora sp. NBC_00240]
MDDVFTAGPFHTVLRSAIAARGLGLERLRDRLAARGLSVSISTLSNWQRGVSRPRRPDSLHVVAVLEAVLDLPGGTLGRLLDVPVRGGRAARPPGAQGAPLWQALRLRALFDEPVDDGLDVLAVQEDVTVTRTGSTATVRLVVRARRPEVDRHVVLTRGSGALPEIRAGRDCRLGRVRTDPEAALVAAELLWAPLGAGETFALEYHLTAGRPEPCHGWWFRRAGQRLDLTVRFAPGTGVDQAYRVWQLDGGSPHKDVATLRVIDGRVHLADYDVPPGFHGIRWNP